MTPIPVIDVAPLRRGEPAAVSRQIGAACRGIGFFCITGHGVAPAETAAVFDHAAAFFRQPLAVKAQAGFTGNRGYVRLGAERLDPGKPADAKEAFNIGLELAPDDPELRAGRPFRAANVWPELVGFRAAMLAYYASMLVLGRQLHQAFAIDLGLDPDSFEDKFRKPMATLRLLHYPPQNAPLEAGRLGAGVHTDYGNVTLLATDAAGGLMVQDRGGSWHDAPVIPGALVCNIGDCLMRWTNDIYVSTPHKVVAPPGRDRHSVAFFLDPDPDAVVACLPGCADAAHPAKYPPVTGAAFLQSRLAPTYQPAG